MRGSRVAEDDEVSMPTMSGRLSQHEAVCAERYRAIEIQFTGSNARLKRIESILLWSAASVMGAAGAIVLLLLSLLLKS